MRTMQSLPHHCFLVFVSQVFAQVLAASIGSTRSPAAPLQDSSSSSTSQECQADLSQQIEQCLVKFQAQYLVYNDADSSAQLRHAMEAMLCREYESSLQCLHFALQACPPTNFHLQLIGNRVGHARYFMQGLCQRVRNDAAATSQLSEPTTTSSSTTTTTSTIEPEIIIAEDSSGDLDTDRDAIESNFIYVTPKVDKSRTLSRNNENEVLSINNAGYKGQATWHKAFKTLELKALKECKDCQSNSVQSIQHGTGNMLLFLSIQLVLYIATL